MQGKGATDAQSATAVEFGDAMANAEEKQDMRSIRLAVMSSFVSKGSSVAYQVISIPLFARVLNPEDFSAIMVYYGITTWLTLVAIGVWPTVSAHAADKRKQGTLPAVVLESALWLSALLGAVIVLALAFRPVLEGSGAKLFSAEYFNLLVAALCCNALIFVFSLGESVNQGQSRQHVNNLIGAASNILNVLFIYVASQSDATADVVSLFVASQLGFILAKFGCFASVLKRVGLPHGVRAPGLARELIVNSRAFLLAQLSGACLQQGAVLLCYESGRAQDAALLALMFRANMLLSSAVWMINQPLWPIAHRHLLDGNTQWLLALYKKLSLLYTAYGVLVIAGAAVLGGYVITFWTSSEFVISNATASLCALYFAIIVSTQAGIPVLMGAKAFASLSRVGMSELMVAGVLGALLLLTGNINFQYVVIALIVANSVTTLWMLPRGALRILRQPR